MVFVTVVVFLGWLVVPSVVFVLSHSLSFVFLGVLPVLPPTASLLSLRLSLLLLPPSLCIVVFVCMLSCVLFSLSLVCCAFFSIE